MQLNEKINVFKYVTADTFDTYSWQTIENKQKFISQIMTSKSPMRSADDMDEQALDYAEIKALCTSNPLIKEKMDLDVSVSRLKLLKANHTSNIHELQDKIRKTLPTRIDILSNSLEKTKEDLDTYNLAKADMLEKHKAIVKAEVIEGLDFSKGESLEDIAEPFAIKIGRTEYEDKTEAGAALIELCRNIKTPDMEVKIGEYCGLELNVKFDSLKHTFKLSLIGKNHYDLELSDSGLGNILRIRNRAEKIKDDIDAISIALDNTKKELEIAKVEVEKPFAKQEEYDTKLARLTEVNLILEQQASNENLDSDEIDITKLAEELNEFSKEFDLYSYMDEVSDEEECINSIINDLKNGNYDGIKEFLNNIIDSEDDDEEQTKAEELLTKIEKIESKTQFLSFTKESMQEDLADKKTSNLTLPKLEHKKDFSL